MIYDLDAERLGELTAAFAAGEQRGRQRTDADLIDLMIELRVEAHENAAKAYREGQEVGAFLTILGVATILVFGLVAWWLL